MHRPVSRELIVAIMLSGAMFAQSQSADSLGDVARTSRAKQQANQAAGTSPKVISNQDISADSPGAPDSAPKLTAKAGMKKVDHSADQRQNNQLTAQQRVSEQWKVRIEDQENRIADLQARIDRVNEAIRTAAGTAQYDTPANRTQAIQLDRLANLQQQLSEQKRKLEQMQDAARHAGAGQ